MAVTSLDAARPASSSGPPRGGGSGRDQLLGAVASTLGVNRAELSGELAQGKSLANIAGSRGVSRDDLVATVQTTLSAISTPDGQRLSSAAISRMANRLIDHESPIGDAASAGSAPPSQPTTAPVAAPSGGASTEHAGTQAGDGGGGQDGGHGDPGAQANAGAAGITYRPDGSPAEPGPPAVGTTVDRRL